MGLINSIIGFFEYIWNSFIVLFFSSGNFFSAIIDIAIVSFIIYKIMQFMRQTRAEQLLKGILVFFLVYFVANLLHLNALKWIVSIVTVNFLVVVVVLFQPELRAIFEKLGRSGISSLVSSKTSDEDQATQETIDSVCDAVAIMHKNKTGALIIFERTTHLNEIVETGTVVDAKCSANLLNNIFFKNSPLHDGAVIVRDNRICAASCILPLSQNPDIDSQLGTRHRASIGVSEISDAVVVVVSEETGNISVATAGKLRRNFTKSLLKNELSNLLITPSEKTTENIFTKLFAKKGGSEDEKN